MYQLPLNFNVSATISAREGHVIPETVTIYDANAANNRNRSITVSLNEFGNKRLPTFYNVNARLEKVINAGEFGKIYIMVDAFNLLNSSHEERRYDRHLGTYYMSDGSFSPNATNYKLNQILGARVFRLGVRFQF